MYLLAWNTSYLNYMGLKHFVVGLNLIGTEEDVKAHGALR
jgi:hypothetical protein